VPISDKYQIIFIHIPKCAGEAVWALLGIDKKPYNLISFSPPVLQHLLPKQLRGEYIPEEKWNAYKKITIIRNPYDRVVSDYFWMQQGGWGFVEASFDEYLGTRETVVLQNSYSENMFYDHFYPLHFYFEDIQFDHVIRYESLEKGIAELRELCQIENPLTKQNASERGSFVLNQEQKDRIYQMYERDFLDFGYER
jgi:hypothetical protein